MWLLDLMIRTFQNLRSEMNVTTDGQWYRRSQEQKDERTLDASSSCITGSTLVKNKDKTLRNKLSRTTAVTKLCDRHTRLRSNADSCIDN
jgi:hypothetical protein